MDRDKIARGMENAELGHDEAFAVARFLQIGSIAAIDRSKKSFSGSVSRNHRTWIATLLVHTSASC